MIVLVGNNASTKEIEPRCHCAIALKGRTLNSKTWTLDFIPCWVIHTVWKLTRMNIERRNREVCRSLSDKCTSKSCD